MREKLGVNNPQDMEHAPRFAADFTHMSQLRI